MGETGNYECRYWLFRCYFLFLTTNMYCYLNVFKWLKEPECLNERRFSTRKLNFSAIQVPCRILSHCCLQLQQNAHVVSRLLCQAIWEVYNYVWYCYSCLQICKPMSAMSCITSFCWNTFVFIHVCFIFLERW